MEAMFNGLNCYADFLMQFDGKIIAAGLYERAKIKAKSIGCCFGAVPLELGAREYSTANPVGWYVDYAKISLKNGRDSFFYILATSKEIGDTYLVTTQEFLEQDLYDYCMEKYSLPLLRWWMPTILKEALDQNLIVQKLGPSMSASASVVADRENLCFPIHGKSVNLRKLLVFHINGLDNGSFTNLVSKCLREQKIWITKKPIPEMNFSSFDDYITKYGSSLVDTLEKQIVPLSPLLNETPHLALKHKRLYPQQAACVNGIIALKKKGIRYGIMNEGMGTGKTIQGAAVVDAYFNQKYMASHPHATPQELYAPGNVNYRTIIMCPGHLVEKWVNEINNEIPGAHAVVLNTFKQLVDIRNAGKERHGKEIFVLSKDFCKLGSQLAPIPTQVKKKYIKAPFCKDCYKEDGSRHLMIGTGHNRHCSKCNGSKFFLDNVPDLPKYRGLICPACNEILLNPKQATRTISGGPDDNNAFLMPWNMAQHTSQNHSCYLCGSSLWGVNVKPLDCGGEYSSLAQRPSKWRRISYYKNAKRKSRETAFVLDGHEDAYCTFRGIKDFEYLPSEYGPRKTAPAHYIKNYLKGYFDFAILDEVHKFEGAGTAQANAAHALIKASDFTLGLTGTISNGSAGSFFYLLFMLDPARMLRKGYKWSAGDCISFCRTYGSLESAFEISGDSNVYHGNSRGRLLHPPRPVPGISPMLFVDFLLDRCVFLDITDLSRFLPPLYERVVTCRLPDEIQGTYQHTISTLKACTHSKEGAAVLTQIFNFGISYPDKVYGRKNIMSTYTPGLVLAHVKSYEEYEDLSMLMPKEKEMIQIIKKEISEDRNCFVYASYTGEAETNITYRLQRIIEQHCNLKGRVQIINATSPAPLKREQWIQQKASEGIRVFITNPKCVETGLDFCFNYKGAEYNYPTIIFIQISNEMAVMWQASRRHYRLNQRKECRTYYLAYENTLQTAALEIMAKKQIATSAIQGKFSSEGLTAMARGVDTRTQLAAALAKNDMSDRNTLTNMFDALNQQNNMAAEDGNSYTPPKTYFELLGIKEVKTGDENDILSIATLSTDYTTSYVPVKTENESDTLPLNAAEPVTPEMPQLFSISVSGLQTLSTIFNSTIAEPEQKKKKHSVKHESSQISLFDVLLVAK